MSETREQKLAREMAYAYSGPQPVDILTPIGRGLRRWVPDLAALPGDIADAVIYGARRAATGNRNTPSAGLGAASRQWARNKIERTEPRQQTEMSALEEYSNPQQAALEEMVAMANPTMWNPRLLARPEVLGGLAAAFGGAPGMLGVVKGKGGNWLTGSVEDALRGLVPKAGAMGRSANSAMEEMLRTYPADKLEMMSPETRATVDAAFARLRPQVSVQNWIEGPLTKYVKTRMASPDDEVRKLAEQGVLHYEPQGGLTDRVIKAREAGGFPVEGLGKSDLARNWETMSDRNLRRDLGRDLSAAERDALMGGKTVPPDTAVYSVRDLDSAADLGFPHLIDELSNALSPASGLPRHLQLTPEAMQNLSMEKAVRRVAEINAWRAEQMAKARLESMAGRPIIREYADNNPKGLRWVQLKREGDFAAESDAMGHSVRGYEPPEKGGHLGYGLGGWPAIQRDKARVFSLQDAKGEPHVTVEIGRGLGKGTRYDSATHYVQNPKKWDSWINSIGGYDGFKKFIKSRDPSFDFRKNNGTSLDILVKVAPDVAGDVGAVELPWYINQIKGKQNRAPNEEYLPFVQDFVRNPYHGGQWSDVGDLENTGLTKHPTGKFVTDAEANALFERHFGHPPDSENAWQYANRIGRYDKDMLTDIDLNFLKDWKEGNFASGGPVKFSWSDMLK